MRKATKTELRFGKPRDVRKQRFAYKTEVHKRNYAQGDENTVALWETAGHTETTVCLQNRGGIKETMRKATRTELRFGKPRDVRKQRFACKTAGARRFR